MRFTCISLKIMTYSKPDGMLCTKLDSFTFKNKLVSKYKMVPNKLNSFNNVNYFILYLYKLYQLCKKINKFLYKNGRNYHLYVFT
jgi:hypothetical protein